MRPFPLAGELVGILRTMVQRTVLPRFDTGPHFALRGAIADELIRDDAARDISQPFRACAAEPPRCGLIPAALDEDAGAIPILINGPPEIMVLPTEREKNFLCEQRRVGVQTIKSIARGPWATTDKVRNTWYQPLEEQADIDRAVHSVARGRAVVQSRGDRAQSR